MEIHNSLNYIMILFHFHSIYLGYIHSHNFSQQASNQFFRRIFQQVHNQFFFITTWLEHSQCHVLFQDNLCNFFQLVYNQFFILVPSQCRIFQLVRILTKIILMDYIYCYCNNHNHKNRGGDKGCMMMNMDNNCNCILYKVKSLVAF